jgi:hypothetical protein
MITANFGILTQTYAKIDVVQISNGSITNVFVIHPLAGTIKPVDNVLLALFLLLIFLHVFVIIQFPTTFLSTTPVSNATLSTIKY